MNIVVCYDMDIPITKQQYENISLNTFVPLNTEGITFLPLKQTMVIKNIEGTKFKIQQKSKQLPLSTKC